MPQETPSRDAHERYEPPVLRAIGSAPRTACASCPASLWHESDALRCFCTVMKTTSWTDGSAPVRRCDGRQTAIAQLRTARAARRG